MNSIKWKRLKAFYDVNYLKYWEKCKTNNEKTDLLFHIFERETREEITRHHHSIAQPDLPAVPHNVRGALLSSACWQYLSGGLCDILVNLSITFYLMTSCWLLAALRLGLTDVIATSPPEKSCWLEPRGVSEEKLVIQSSPTTRTINKLALN